jgi:hypothetical protein
MRIRAMRSRFVQGASQPKAIGDACFCTEAVLSAA